MKKKRKHPTEFWIFDTAAERRALVNADGRPVILKNRKTAVRFIAEMGMDANWSVEERPAMAVETRGRKPKDNPGLKRALWEWALMRPKMRPKRYEDQRAFTEKHCGTLTGNTVQKRKAVRAFIKMVRRLHEAAQTKPPSMSL